jgi:hypothetical protein
LFDEQTGDEESSKTDSDDDELDSHVSSLSDSTNSMGKKMKIKKRKNIKQPTAKSTPTKSRKKRKTAANEDTPLTSNQKSATRRKYNLRQSAKKNYSYKKGHLTNIVGVKPQKLYDNIDYGDEDGNDNSNKTEHESGKSDLLTSIIDDVESDEDGKLPHKNNNNNNINMTYNVTVVEDEKQRSLDNTVRDGSEINISNLSEECGMYVQDLEDVLYEQNDDVVPTVAAVCCLCRTNDALALKKCRMCPKYVHLRCILRFSLTVSVDRKSNRKPENYRKNSGIYRKIQ